MQLGAVILKIGPDVLSDAIAWFSQARGEGPAIATHQGSGRDCVYTVHATKVGAVRIPWTTYKHACEEAGASWCVLVRVIPHTAIEQMVIARLLDEMTGHDGGGKPWKYSVLEIGLQMADGIINKALREETRRRLPGTVQIGRHHEIFWFRRYGNLIARRVICSRTGNRWLARVDDVPAVLEHGSPDDTADYLLHSGKWTIDECSPGWERHIDRVTAERLRMQI